MKTKIKFSTLLCIAGFLFSALLSQYAHANEALWIEGEDYKSSSWNYHSWYRQTNITKDLLSPGRPGITGGDWHVHFTDNDYADSATGGETINYYLAYAFQTAKSI